MSKELTLTFRGKELLFSLDEKSCYCTSASQMTQYVNYVSGDTDVYFCLQELLFPKARDMDGWIAIYQNDNLYGIINGCRIYSCRGDTAQEALSDLEEKIDDLEEKIDELKQSLP
jgi:hypothetical protein